MYIAETVAMPTTSVGLLWLVILTLCGVIVWQQVRADKCASRYDELQEKRLADHQGALAKNTDVMDNVGQQLAVLTAKIESVRNQERGRL